MTNRTKWSGTQFAVDPCETDSHLEGDFYRNVKDAMRLSRPATALSRQEGGAHYKDFVIQPAEFITRNGIGFLEGCVIKRMCRHGAKNKAEDLRKAIHEIELLLELEYGEKS